MPSATTVRRRIWRSTPTRLQSKKRLRRSAADTRLRWSFPDEDGGWGYVPPPTRHCSWRLEKRAIRRDASPADRHFDAARRARLDNELMTSTVPGERPFES